MKYLVLILVLIVTGCGGLALPNGGHFPADRSLTTRDSGILGIDNGAHFLAGMGTAIVTTEILRHTTSLNYKQRRVYGCAAATTAGLAKEFYDRDIMGTRFEPLDAVYTAAGCLFTFRWEF